MTGKPLVLVTGATGFAGSHMVDLLLEEGRRVRVLVRRTSDLQYVPRDRVEMVVADVRDPVSLQALVSGVQEIYHFGGLTRARNRAAFFEVNCAGTQRLATAWLKANPAARRFIYISSLAASGPAPDAQHPRREDDPPAPMTAYGESKLASEVWLDTHLAPRVQTLSIRPPAVYGPRDDATLTLFRWIRRGLLPLPAPLEGRVSIIMAPELARAALLLAEAAAAGVFHVSDGKYYSWLEIGQCLASILGRRPLRVRVPGWCVRAAGEAGELIGWLSGAPPVINRDKASDVRQCFWTCSIEKARNHGFEPRVSMEDGMLRTVQWYQTAGWL
jgi:dihydroflavonol-4-reductase